MTSLQDVLLGRMIDPVSVLLRLIARRKHSDIEGYIILLDEQNRCLADEQNNILIGE